MNKINRIILSSFFAITLTLEISHSLVAQAGSVRDFRPAESEVKRDAKSRGRATLAALGVAAALCGTGACAPREPQKITDPNESRTVEEQLQAAGVTLGSETAPPETGLTEAQRKELQENVTSPTGRSDRPLVEFHASVEAAANWREMPVDGDPQRVNGLLVPELGFSVGSPLALPGNVLKGSRLVIEIGGDTALDGEKRFSLLREDVRDRYWTHGLEDGGKAVDWINQAAANLVLTWIDGEPVILGVGKQKIPARAVSWESPYGKFDSPFNFAARNSEAGVVGLTVGIPATVFDAILRASFGDAAPKFLQIVARGGVFDRESTRLSEVEGLEGATRSFFARLEAYYRERLGVSAHAEYTNWTPDSGLKTEGMESIGVVYQLESGQTLVWLTGAHMHGNSNLVSAKNGKPNADYGVEAGVAVDVGDTFGEVFSVDLARIFGDRLKFILKAGGVESHSTYLGFGLFYVHPVNWTAPGWKEVHATPYAGIEFNQGLKGLGGPKDESGSEVWLRGGIAFGNKNPFAAFTSLGHAGYGKWREP